MNQKLIELHRQRARLQERISSQRVQLTQQWAPVEKALDSGQRWASLLGQAQRYLKQHPLPVLLAVVALVIVKPRRAWRGLRWSVGLWRAYRTARALVPPKLWALLFPALTTPPSQT